ncbi:hypothetical protein AX14_008480 [Amanita brunnescens Koide BX004]|nr:hypothetical protein AX14_008480 [Amanita brunnescens Koide BX004]
MRGAGANRRRATESMARVTELTHVVVIFRIPNLMSSPPQSKGKQKALDEDVDEESDAETTSSSGSSSYSSESDSEGEGQPSEIEKDAASHNQHGTGDEDVIALEKEPPPIPRLGTGIPTSIYLQLDGAWPRLLDPEVEKAEKAASGSAPAPPIPPPELNRDGTPVTKKQKKELKKKTAGPSWFDLPAPSEGELPRLYHEVEALRLRNQLDPKRFYRKDVGEGKGIKGLPKYFSIGTIVPSTTPFGTASADNLPKSHRKRTIVEELVDDAEARRYTKKKFNELQAVRESKGKKTLAAKKSLRQPKW